MKNLPLIEVTELIKGIESSDNFQDDLSIADLNGDLINYEEKRLEHSTPMRLNALLMILVQECIRFCCQGYISLPCCMEPHGYSY